MVQRRAARYTLNRFWNTSSVSEMLTHLNWISLETRHQHARLTMMYKMTNGLAAVQYQQYITQVERASCHTGSHCFQTHHSDTDYHRNSYFPQYENGITCPRTLLRPHPCPYSEEGWPTCKPTQTVFIHTHALLHYYSHSCTLHTPHPVHNLQPIEVWAVSMMKMKIYSLTYLTHVYQLGQLAGYKQFTD